MNIKTALAIDPGTHMGWAVLYPDGSVGSGVVHFKTKRTDSNNMKMLLAENWVEETIDCLQPDIVYYETPHHRGGASTACLVNIAGSVIRACEKFNIAYRGIHSKTLKKEVTGAGNAGKEDMIAEAEKRFPGEDIESDDQADALLLLSLVIEHFRVKGES
jgi:Holliday junction resolvasome RuvABC endonuclease subunit